MQPDFFKKANSSLLNMALATSSLLGAGTAYAYSRTREHFQGGAPQYVSQFMRGTQFRPSRFVQPFSFKNTAAPSAITDRDLRMVRGHQVRELVIIDHAVPQKHLFYSQARPGIEIVEVESTESGLAGLQEILGRYHGLDAVHLFSHATAGALQLGNDRVTTEELKADPEFFAVINQAIRPSGDFLLYGCELGKGEAGAEFLEIIRQHTHADLAASDDLTGSSELDGDWDLEITVGNIEATPIGNSPALKDFTEILQLTTFSFNATTNTNPFLGTTPMWPGTYETSRTLNGFTFYIGTGYTVGGSRSVGMNGASQSVSITAPFDFTIESININYLYEYGGTPGTLNISHGGGAIPSGDGTGLKTVADAAGATDWSFTAGTMVTLQSVFDGGSGFVASVCNFRINEIVLSGSPALPVEVSHFEARRMGESINLNWATTSEQNNQGFEIQQSVDGETFEQIGFVAGAGNSSGEQDYSFSLWHQGAAYYRFRQIDMDGQFSYSQTRYIEAWVPDREPRVYPNPIGREVFIENLEENVTLVVDIFDLHGRQLAILPGSKQEVEQQLSERFAALSQGIYLLQLRTPDRVFTQKVIKE